jgi:hypothetical protein
MADTEDNKVRFGRPNRKPPGSDRDLEISIPSFPSLGKIAVRRCSSLRIMLDPIKVPAVPGREYFSPHSKKSQRVIASKTTVKKSNDCVKKVSFGK